MHPKTGTSHYTHSRPTFVIARRGKAPTRQSSGREPQRPLLYTLSLRGAQRRGNPATAQVNHRIAPASYVTHQTGLPRHDVARNDSVEGDDPDWIATPRRTRNYSLQARHVLQRGRGSSFRRSRMDSDGGRGGIRTPGTVSGSAVFKTAALDHSATLPEVGATCRTRTDDLRFTKPLLYQLS